MSSDFAVSAASGSLRSAVHADAVLPHEWTDAGVAVELRFTGAHLLHLAVAACILNDLHREAARMGIALNGVLVVAGDDFDRDTWCSLGVDYRVRIDSDAGPGDLTELIRVVDDVAEIPKALGNGAAVARVE